MIEMKQEMLTENTQGSLLWLKIQQEFPRTLNLMGCSQRCCQSWIIAIKCRWSVGPQLYSMSTVIGGLSQICWTSFRFHLVHFLQLTQDCRIGGIPITKKESIKPLSIHLISLPAQVSNSEAKEDFFLVERQELSKMMGATARWNKCQARTCSNIPLHNSMRTIFWILRTFCWILRTICWILHTFWHKFAALAAKRLFGGTWEVGWVSVKGGACATPVAEDLWQPDWAWYELWDTVLNTFEGKDRNQVRWAQLPGDRSANPGRCRTCLILRLCQCATPVAEDYWQPGWATTLKHGFEHSVHKYQLSGKEIHNLFCMISFTCSSLRSFATFDGLENF